MSQANKYNPVTEAIIEKLKSIVGEKYVICGDKDALEAFSHDEIPDRRYAHMPDVVVRPRTTEEISAIMKLANTEMIPVTPRGAGSGMSGGAVPIHGGIVLFVDRMNSIIELDKDNMMIVVEPGVIANEINEYLAEHKLFFAGYPMSMETCYIGGNVADAQAHLNGDFGIMDFVGRARAFLKIQEEFGTFDDYIWGFTGNKTIINKWKDLNELPTSSVESDNMSLDLKKRGFKFVGTTICYAFMQATGMVNDHTTDCFRYREVMGQVFL